MLEVLTDLTGGDPEAKGSSSDTISTRAREHATSKSDGSCSISDPDLCFPMIKKRLFNKSKTREVEKQNKKQL